MLIKLFQLAEQWGIDIRIEAWPESRKVYISVLNTRCKCFDYRGFWFIEVGTWNEFDKLISETIVKLEERIKRHDEQ